MVILISDKIYSKTKLSLETGHFIMKNPKYMKKKLTDLKKEIEYSIVIVGHFNKLLLIMDKKVDKRSTSRRHI